MDQSAFLYDNLPQPLENNDLMSEECHQYISKMNLNKTLFRIQSPEPSIQDDFLQNEIDQSFDVDFMYVNDENKYPYDEDEDIQCSKKIQKAKKLKKKNKDKRGPLSEKEFIEIMKKLEQCQQVMNMIDNMTMILNGFKHQLQKQMTPSLN
ncbi:unnamed protein product [Paramecium primaurelia]|uniref:Uncharacterized protein n=1 Tax=Paramecium primaurelia TaxID=5886 RepID=A0A8S1KJH0_PARPR|nr:unnamed protein product [Paramecium primaurelia]